jgi:hypothetical protein
MAVARSSSESLERVRWDNGAGTICDGGNHVALARRKVGFVFLSRIAAERRLGHPHQWLDRWPADRARSDRHLGTPSPNHTRNRPGDQKSANPALHAGFADWAAGTP